jgi:peptidoglycan/LPS O-acetylase OafA/YrhL
MERSAIGSPLKQTAHRNPAAHLRLHGLDTLRSVAILTVMAFHTYELHAANTIPDALLPVVKMCWAGVDLFFVLSGYLIGSQLLRPYAQARRVPAFSSLWTFYFKRFFRVLPVYAVVLSLYLALPVWREAPHMAAPWQFFTFTENLFVNYPRDRAFSHVWSLCVEEHFYLLLPLIVLLMMRKPTFAKTAGLIAGVVLLGIGIRTFVLFHWMRPLAEQGHSFIVPYVKLIYFPTYSRLDGLLAGVTLAVIKLFRPAWWNALAQRGHTLTLAGAGFVGVALWLSKDRFVSAFGTAAFGAVFAFPLLSLGLGLLVASALSNNGLLSRYRVPGARIVAALAYTLYLSHKGILHLGEVYFPAISAAGGLRWIALFASTAFAASAILYLCVERPFMLLRDNLLSKHKTSVDREMQVEPAL